MSNRIQITLDFLDMEEVKSTQIDLITVLQQSIESPVEIQGSGYLTLETLGKLTQGVFESYLDLKIVVDELKKQQNATMQKAG